MKDFLDTIDGLQLPQGEIIGDLLPVLTDGVLRQRLGQFGEQIRVYRELRKAVERTLGQVPNFDLAKIDDIRKIVATAQRILPTAHTVADLDRIASELESAIDRLTQAQTRYTGIARRLGIDLALSRRGLSLVRHALALLHTAPLDVVHRRHAGLKREGVAATIQAARKEADSLRKMRAALSQRLHLDLAPPSAEVRQHAAVSANAGWFRFLNQEFKAAKRTYTAMVRTSGKFRKEDMKKDFQELSTYLDYVQRFEAKRVYQEVADTHFEGIDTPFDELRRLIEWWEQIHQTFEEAGELGVVIGEALWSGLATRLNAGSIR